jgi:hypothetical protein
VEKKLSASSDAFLVPSGGRSSSAIGRSFTKYRWWRVGGRIGAPIEAIVRVDGGKYLAADEEMKGPKKKAKGVSATR